MAFDVFSPGHPLLQTRPLWHAEKTASRKGHTLLLCRQILDLRERCSTQLWISASQRFILYLDGRLLGRGPSRSDQDRWGARSYELDLEPGEHVLSVMLTHRGVSAGKAQLGGPGFLATAFEGNVPGQIRPWRSFHHGGFEPVQERVGKQKGHLSVGAGEAFNGAGFPWGWKQASFEDRMWAEMRPVAPTFANPWGNRVGGYLLRPDPIPPMLEYPLLVPSAKAPFPVKIAARAKWKKVVDVGHLTNAYIKVIVGSGRGAAVRIITCEAPVDPASSKKGDRNLIEGKELPGMLDVFYPGGTEQEVFETTWLRAFRYLVIEVETGGESLRINEMGLWETRFPLEAKALITFGGDALWPDLLEVTQRTAFLCAHETTFDCPHYEQGQFGGDSRIQAIYHYLICDDDRLIRKTIDDLAASRVSNGLLRSHYPADFHQIIPTFSLYWIGILNDFRVYRGNADSIRPYLPQAREIVQWFADRMRPDGLLGFIPFAPFIDWAFPQGNAPQDADGGSTILTCLFAQACNWLERLEHWAGYPELAPRWKERAENAIAAVRLHLQAGTGRLPDTIEGETFSLHGQVEAILAGAIEHQDAAGVLEAALDNPQLRQPSSFYYRYYVAQSATKSGRNDLVHRILQPWFRVLEGMGLTTLPENVENPRSDCHAWSVFSGIAPITHIMGLRPDEESQGMAQLIWEPALGDYPKIGVTFPTPHGSVAAELFRSRDHLQARIDTPIPVIMPAQQRSLPPGKHDIRFRL